MLLDCPIAKGIAAAHNNRQFLIFVKEDHNSQAHGRREWKAVAFPSKGMAAVLIYSLF